MQKSSGVFLYLVRWVKLFGVLNWGERWMQNNRATLGGICIRGWRWVDSAVFTRGLCSACTTCLIQVLKNGAVGKILFLCGSQEGSREPSEEEAACVSTSATHVFKGRGVLPQSLSLPALYSEFPFMIIWKHQSFPSECVFVCTNVSSSQC